MNKGKTKYVSLNKKDLELVQEVKTFLLKNYSFQKHHAASILVCGSHKYYSLHLDTKGFDVCAEPGNINQAILSGEKEFTTIISAGYYDEDVHIINPCGNCRQLFLTFCPLVKVIVNYKNKLSKIEASNLLPFPYI